MGKGGGSAKQKVDDYYMSVHLGVCHGPAELKAIIVGEKIAWEGTASAESTLSISKRDLFGGNKKEGGVAGQVRFMPGDPPASNPSMLESLAKRLGKTAATCPAFTGLCNLFFVGSVSADTGGFYWSSNSPYLKSVWAKVRRIPTAFSAAIGEPSNYSNMGTEANPSHMIYECLTNTEWGAGTSSSMIDTSSFQNAAKILSAEGFGLSMIWTQQATIESFISEILDHIQGTLFTNPKTGLLTLKLIRDDYNPELLAELTPDNCRVTKFQRKLWGETINEINVSWTNPENEEEEVVTMHDLANIEMQGGIVSETRNYYGVRTAALAAMIAARDIRSAAAPLASYEIVADRRFWFLVPGDVIKITYPKYKAYGVVLRVNNVDYGKPGDSRIKITAIEDIFGLPQSSYSVPSGTGWSEQSFAPTDMAHTEIITLPYFFSAKVAARAALSAVDYPSVLLGMLASTPVSDARSFELYAELADTTGTLVWTDLGTKAITPRTETLVDIPAQAETILTAAQAGLSYLSVGGAPEAGGFAVLGTGDDTKMEICLISHVATDYSSITLQRGVMDTTPKAWPKGTALWFIDSEGLWGDSSLFADGESPNLKALMSTSLGTQAVDDGIVYSEALSGRPHYPLRPANVTVGGTSFGVYYHSGTGDIAVTWANRNRLTEDTQIVKWTDGDVTGEVGQTTKISVLDMDRNEITVHDGLAGTSFSLPFASLGGLGAVIVRVTAERDGFESLQGHEILVSDGTGYGTDYGNDYGGT